MIIHISSGLLTVILLSAVHLDSFLAVAGGNTRSTPESTEQPRNVSVITTAFRASLRRRILSSHHYPRCLVQDYTRWLTYPDCRPLRVQYKGCSGYCLSSTYPSTLVPGTGLFTSPNHPTMHHRCFCCRPFKQTIEHLTLQCSNKRTRRAYRIRIKVHTATECKCRPCTTFD